MQSWGWGRVVVVVRPGPQMQQEERAAGQSLLWVLLECY